jgi:hypothetical protein
VTAKKSKPGKRKAVSDGKSFRHHIHVKDARSARRLLSRMLTQLQVEMQRRDRLNLAAVRCAIASISELVNLLRASDYEQRLQAVEKTLQGER